MEKETHDALTEILQRLRLRAGVYVHADFCGNWAVDTAGQRKVPFHLIGRGSRWLHTDDTQESRLLDAGDLFVFPYDAHHVISSSAGLPPAAILPPPASPGRAILAFTSGAAARSQAQEGHRRLLPCSGTLAAVHL